MNEKNVMLNFTYQDLRNTLATKLTLKHAKVPSSFHNQTSSLRTFLGDMGNTFESQIGAEFTYSFNIELRKHLELQRGQGRTEQNLRDRKSHIKSYRAFYMNLKRENADIDEKAPFQQALIDCLQDLQLKALAKQSGVPLNNLKRWKTGEEPSLRSIPAVRRLETFLALPQGTLTDLLPHQKMSTQVTFEADQQIPYRKKLSEQSKVPYRLKNDISESLRQEWIDFLDYKTTLLPLGYKRSKSGRWSESNNPVLENPNKRWFSFHMGRYIPSASMNWRHIATYFGWIKNYSGVTDFDNLQTMGLFIEKCYLDKYISWWLRRSDNLINGGHLSFVNFILSLVHPETGYLTQHSELRNRMLPSISLNDWNSKCQDVFKHLKELKVHIMSTKRRSRNPFDPIKAVVSLDNPLLALKDMLGRMRADRPSPGTKQEAIWARDLVLVNLLMCTPLRLTNLRAIKWLPDNTGNLYYHNQGWHLRLSAENFKNRNGAAKDSSFDIELDPSMETEINNYISKFRPILLKGRPNDGELFVSSRGKLTNGWVSLSRRIESLTRKYLMGCPGVGPQAVRHIIATAIIKKSGDFSTAALVLHDREDTVRQNYAHLKPNDGHRKYRAMFSDK